MRTVNLKVIANTFSGRAKKDSVYKRIQQFFKGFSLDSLQIARFILTLIPKGPYWLTMDRTNWKFGKQNINILTVGIVYKGIAFPLFWKMLSKQGNSNTTERKEIIRKACKFLGKKNIVGFLADREFVGKDWFHFLRKEKIPFVIRVKENFLIPGTKKRHIRDLIRGKPKEVPVPIPKAVLVCGKRLFVSGMTVDGEYLIVVSDHPSKKAIEEYLRRWEIETLFGCLKSRGFNFEDTHMVDPERVSKLMALLTIAFCWVHAIGEWQNKIQPIKIKKYVRKSVSIFRYGLDLFQHVLFNIHSKYALFMQLLSFLSCT